MIPIAATPIRIRDLFYGIGKYKTFLTTETSQGKVLSSPTKLANEVSCKQDSPLRNFQEALAEYFKVRYCLLVNSGTAALFLILKALSRKNVRKEVVLPAYTAHSLVLPIKRLGLKVIPCDINLNTFNLDIDYLKKTISDDTLCIVAVHLFGIPCDIENIMDITKEKGIFVIEDVAQAQGTTINTKLLGTFGDIGFFSFNRGKNLPTYSGGCIVTNLKELADIIKGEMSSLEKPHIFSRFVSILKLVGLSLATKPFFYSLFYSLISHFKSNEAPCDFTLLEYTDFQSKVGLALLDRCIESNEKRYQNGMTLLSVLKDIDGIIIPEIPVNARPAFNRLPIVFRDLNLKEKIEKRLWQSGIETSRMYIKPIHPDFPNATYLAHHLLTLPVHPLVRENDLANMLEVFTEK